jgi:hypothetical protein
MAKNSYEQYLLYYKSFFSLIKIIVMKFALKVIIVLIFFNTNYLFAQTAAPLEMSIFVVVSSMDTSSNWGDNFSSSTVVEATMKCKLSDTTNISNVIVRVGTSPGGSDLFNKSFNYHSIGTFSDNTSFYRYGKNIKIGLGNYTGLNDFYGELQLQSTSGVLSNIITYHNK